MANVTSATNHFPTAQEGFNTTTSSSVTSGATSVALNTVAGYNDGDVVALVIDPTDALKKQVFTGVVDATGTQITDVVWTEGDNQDHLLGATVVDYETATAWALQAKGMTVEHDQDGTHSAAFLTSIYNVMYPIGSVYTNASVSTNPATLLGFGTWVAFGSGRVMVGVDAAQTEFDTLGETGGAKTHTLTMGQLAAHSFGFSHHGDEGGSLVRNVWASGATYAGGTGVGVYRAAGTATGGASSIRDPSWSFGSNEPHNNLQPYVTVHMWKRTA